MLLTSIPFEGDELQATFDGSDVWVSLRRMCEALGVDVDSQRKKLNAKPWARTVLNTVHDSSGRAQQMFMLHLDAVPMWLATIEESRVAEHVRPKLQKYQAEAAKVLADHFLGPRAPATAPARAPRDDVAAARERRLADRERRLGEKASLERADYQRAMLAELNKKYELDPSAVQAIEVSIFERVLDTKVPLLKPPVTEVWYTATELAEAFNVTANRIGRTRKAIGLIGTREGLTTVRLGDRAHTTGNAEQTLFSRTAGYMIGASLVHDRHILPARFEQTIRELGLVEPEDAKQDTENPQPALPPPQPHLPLPGREHEWQAPS